MQTSITPSHLATPAGKEADAILRNCVHCGFCNATCPTYQVFNDELDGPRGRIYLIKQVLEGHTPGPHVQQHLDRCLTCLNCETTCPSGVRYSLLLETGRHLVNEQVTRSLFERVKRVLIEYVLLSPRLFRFLLRSGQLVRPFMPVFIKKLIPVKVKTRGVTARKLHKRKMLFLDGCVQPTLAPNTNLAMESVLDKLGISLLHTRHSCCGAVSFHLDHKQNALGQIKSNIDAWWPYIKSGEVEAIVISASGCGSMIKDYGRLLIDDDTYKDKARRISELCRDLCEVIKDEDTTKLAPNNRYKRVAFHPPCTLQHGQKINGVVESILTSAGFELAPFADSHLCCGSAGTYSLLQSDISDELLMRKIGNIRKTRADVIVTANIGCQAHLQKATQLPVLHWVELLSETS